MAETFHQRGDAMVHATLGASTCMHALHAHKLVIPLDAPLTLRWPDGQALTLDAPALIPAHVTQEMGSPGQTLALFWEIDSPVGLVLGANAHDRLLVLGEPSWWRDAARDALDHLEDPEAADAILGAPLIRLGWRAERPLDGRIRRARRLLRQAPGHALSRDALAAATRLSPSRLSHLFRAETGTSLRHFALWLRAHDALGHLLAGVPIARAAQLAHFSDHAHLTRSMGQLFGQPPSYVTRPQTRSIYVQDEPFAQG